MEIFHRRSLLVLQAAVAMLAAGCATQIVRKAEAPQPSRVKFGGFKSVELAPVVLPAPYAEHGYNRDAAAKIDELLSRDLSVVFPGLRKFDSGAPAATSESTLRIEPAIEDIKFIGGAARFWVGAMAGSSTVLLKVAYRDAATGEVIAEPEFQRVSNAWAGGMSMGRTDNAMLEDVVRDVVNYSVVNR